MLFGQRKIEGVLAKDAGGQLGSLTLPSKRNQFDRVVASWQTKEDVKAWATKYNISVENLIHTGWLVSNKVIIEGIEYPLQNLYRAIKRNERFRDNFPSFQTWIGAEVRVNFKEVVSNWKSKDDATVWCAKHGISQGQLESSYSLQRKKITIQGVKYNLENLYSAITSDPRFLADFSKFKSWMGFQLRVSFRDIVSDWKNENDATAWAIGHAISRESLTDSKWLNKNKVTIEGVEYALSNLFSAIKRDHRFLKDFSKFQSWMGIEARCNFNEVVSNWKTKDDAIAWATKHAISIEGLTNSNWLSDNQIPIDGVEYNLKNLYAAIKRDHRFLKDFSKFQSWMGIEPRCNFNELVSSWKTKDDAISWATKHAISIENLTNSAYLRNSQVTIGGVNYNLFNLYAAIRRDERFFEDLSKFQSWMGFDARCDFNELVSSWKTKDDAIAWAANHAISIENLTKSNWLSANQITINGVEYNLNNLYVAIKRDQRFLKDFSKFQSWMGIEARLHFQDLVSNWKTKDDAIAWATKHAISIENITKSRWLSANQITIDGVECNLYNLYKAIKRDQRFLKDFSKFQSWMGIEARYNFNELVSSWKTKDDAIAWAANYAISIENLTKSKWLSVNQITIEGVEYNLNKLYMAIKRDQRFLKDFSKFQSWMGIEAKYNFDALVSSW